MMNHQQRQQRIDAIEALIDNYIATSGDDREETYAFVKQHMLQRLEEKRRGTAS